MNYFLKMIVAFVLLMGAWCCAESFLMTHKPDKRRTPGQLKEEIVEAMGELLENQAMRSEVNAQIQQALCKHIRAIAHQDKASYFKAAGIADLNRILKQLQEENLRCRKEYGEDRRFLSSLRSYKSQQEN